MERPQRKLPRLPGYDYATPNYYFVTICTHEKQCIFGNPNQLNLLGKLIEQTLLKTSEHFPSVQIDKYVIMPNHIHAIVTIGRDGTERTSHTLPAVIGSFKSAASREIHKHSPGITVWQKSFYDHIVRNDTAYQEIWQYIESNPQNWERDEFHSL